MTSKESLLDYDNVPDSTRLGQVVDFSGQGLTMVPSSLFNRTDITELILSGNNVRSLPPVIHQLTVLHTLDISRNNLTCGGEREFGSLPKELARLTSLRKLSLSECTLTNVPFAVWSIPTLTDLDLSKNPLDTLSSLVGNLGSLVYLNVQHSGLRQLPPEIVCCEALETMLLYGNPLEDLPDTIRELNQLRQLGVSLKIFSYCVTPSMDEMIRTKQITSQHVPPVVFELQQMTEMNLENCKINALPSTILCRLTSLSIEGNYFDELPDVVTTMYTLEDLNVSRNVIREIPDCIKRLERLRRFVCNDTRVPEINGSIFHIATLSELAMEKNEIEAIPSEISKASALRTLNLAFNKIAELPTELCALTELETLDLTSNQISILPSAIQSMTGLKKAHMFHGLYRVGLWLYKNPITNPPDKIWKGDNPDKVWEFLKNKDIQDLENVQPLKVTVIGDHMSGKTTLINAAIGKPSLTLKKEPKKPISSVVWTNNNGIPFVFHDLCCSSTYIPLIPLWLSCPALYLLVFDVSGYDDSYASGFYRLILYWLRILQMYVPGAVVQLVGCHADKVDMALCDDEGFTIKDRIEQDIELYLEEEKREKHLIVLSDVVLVASTTNVGSVIGLRDKLEQLSLNRTYFPHCSKQIPKRWMQFRHRLNSQQKHFLTVEEVSDLAIEDEIYDDDEIAECVDYLANSGMVYVCKTRAGLHNLIFPRVSRLIDILVCILRIELTKFLDYDINRVFRVRSGMSESQFDEAKHLFEEGSFSWPMLKAFVFDLSISSRRIAPEVVGLLQRLSLVYVYPMPRLPPLQLHSHVMLVVPQLVTQSRPESLPDDLWPRKCPAGIKEWSSAVMFPNVEPPGFFHCLSAQLHPHVDTRRDWRDCVVAKKDTVSILLLNQCATDFSIKLCLRSMNVGHFVSLQKWFTDQIEELKSSAVGLLLKQVD